MVGLKQPPESAPTIEAMVYKVSATVKAPKIPSFVARILSYFVWTITVIKMVLNINSSKKTWNKGSLLSRGFKTNGTVFCYKPAAKTIPL